MKNDALYIQRHNEVSRVLTGGKIFIVFTNLIHLSPLTLICMIASFLLPFITFLPSPSFIVAVFEEDFSANFLHIFLLSPSELNMKFIEPAGHYTINACPAIRTEVNKYLSAQAF